MKSKASNYCVICHDEYKMPLTFCCNRHMACAKCIISLYNSKIFFDDNEYKCGELACPICRKCSDITHSIKSNTTLQQLLGVYPIADDIYDMFEWGETRSGASSPQTPSTPSECGARSRPAACAPLDIREREGDLRNCALSHSCPYCAYTGNLKEICNHILNNCVRVPVLCPLCKKYIELGKISNHKTSLCFFNKCQYCDCIDERRRIRTHEQVHLVYKKLQLQLLGIASMIDTIQIPIDSCKSCMKIEAAIDLININRKMVRRL